MDYEADTEGGAMYVNEYLAMKPGMKFTKAGSDEDMVELRIEIYDGNSSFVNRIYVGHRQLQGAVDGLRAFKDQIHGGLFHLRFGEFGPEYAAGALEARLQFRKRGKLLVQVSAQSAFERFEDQELASEAKLWLVTEPALLDTFIDALRAMTEGCSEHAALEAIPWM
jgi:hypothetical protein